MDSNHFPRLFALQSALTLQIIEAICSLMHNTLQIKDLDVSDIYKHRALLG